MQKINSSLFQESVFNIGAGKDLNPLIRFAHYSDTFIYTNLYLGFEEIFSWYKNQFLAHPDFELLDTEVVEDRAYSLVFEQGARDGLYVRPVYPFNAEFFMREYTNVFHPASREANWLIYFEVKFKPLNKILKLYYYNGEGLATYLRLSKSGDLACRVMVTVQTGVLEFPKRELNQFFSMYAAPKIWVRGYEPMDYSSYGKPLFATGYFGKIGMSFNHHWSVGSYNPNPWPERYCKGFITKETWERLSQRPELTQWNEQHFLFRGRIENSPLVKDGDLVVLPKNLQHLENQFTAKVQLIYWETLVGSKDFDFSDRACSTGAVEQFSALSNTLEKTGISSDTQVHLVPFCLESEMDIYKQEVMAFPYKTVSYALQPLDFTSWEELEGAAHREESLLCEG